MNEKVAITGANGNLGVRLIGQLGVNHVRALVRSDSAKQALLSRYPELEIEIVDYTSASSLNAALESCCKVVHLVGILKQTRFSSYEAAHEASCKALVAALPTSVTQIVYLSILGSRPESTNLCLASKGRAEAILESSNVDVAVIQVPMVLGEGDYASAALRRNAMKSIAFTFRAESLEQPIFAGDVVSAIVASFTLTGKTRLELSGPESLTRRQLFKRAAAIHSKDVAVVSLPIGLGMALAWCFEKLANAPVTRDMLGVLDHDDHANSNDATKALGIELTSLDDMLKKTIL